MNLANRWILGCALAVLALTSAGAAGDASAQNILVNPGFETGDLSSWVVAGASPSANVSVVATDNGPSAPGTHSAFVENRSEANGLTVKQTSVPGTAGPGTVSYSFDLKLGEALNGGVFFVELFAEQSGVGIVGQSGLLGNYDPADWTNFSGSFVAPAGTDFITIQFTAVTGANIGTASTMFVDNVVVSQGSVPVELMSWGSTKAQFDR